MDNDFSKLLSRLRDDVELDGIFKNKIFEIIYQNYTIYYQVLSDYPPPLCSISINFNISEESTKDKLNYFLPLLKEYGISFHYTYKPKTYSPSNILVFIEILDIDLANQSISEALLYLILLLNNL